MFPIECALKVGMHSSLVSCDPVSRMLRLNGLLLQSPMELVAPDLKGKAVIGDDKDHSKIWVADQGDLCRYVAECVEMDQTWAKRDDLRASWSRSGSGRVRSGGVAEAWEAGDCWQCEIPDCVSLGQR